MPPSKPARLSWLAALAIGVCALASPALAQGAWPAGPVRVIVPFPPGGGADGVPRILADYLSRKWGQPVVVENKPGAAGNIGAEAAARAAPDGYTLLSGPTPVWAVNVSLYKKLAYDPTSFKPVALLALNASALSVHPSLGVKTVAELIAKAKAEPGLPYGSAGNGSTQHLTAAMFEHMTGVRLTHVPYRGSGPLMNDLVGGHIKLTFDNLAGALPQHNAGKVVMLAVCTPTRSQFIPEMPTMIEAGVPGFVSSAWYAMGAPPGTPDAIIDKVNADINELLKLDEIKQKLAGLGAEPMGGSPADMAAYAAAERKRWAEVISAAAIPLIE